MAKPAENQDRQQAAAFLRLITSQWYTLREKAHIELRALFPGKPPQIARFAPDDTGIDLAVDFACMFSAQGYNIYPVINPVRASAPLRRDGKQTGATDDDIICSFFCWADGDDEAAVYAIKNFAGPKYSFAVTTGKTPFPRPHIYWALEEPIYNLTTWTQIQRGIAAQLSTDKTVVNPSRIMRLPGMINWPTEKKAAKGYIPELATLRTEYEDERTPVSAERMWRIFGEAGEKAESRSSGQEQAGGFSFDPGDHHENRTAEDYADILRRARTDGEKHSGVRDLAASLAGQGVNRALAEAIIREACPVWDAGVEKLISSAYEKFSKAKEGPQFDFTPEWDAADGGETGWTIQTAAEFTADFVAPEYIIEGVAQRGRLYTLTAPTGSGKTAAMLYAATAIATGMQFCGRECEPGDVLFLAGENPDDVRARFIATMEFYGIAPKECRVHFIAGTFSIRADLKRLQEEAEKLPNLMMVVVDTFAAYFDGEDENSNAQALDFARVVRRLTVLQSKPGVMMPAHPVKNATRQNLTPKGGSSLLNEVDGNLTIWNSDGLLSLHWQGKHRGPDFEPLNLELTPYESDTLKDRKGRRIPTILAKPVLEMRKTQMARETLSLEDRLLCSIADDSNLTKRQRAEVLGISPSRCQRLIDRLRDQKLIKKFRTKWELTSEGERAVSEIVSGETPPPEADE